jgi:hypothetical protein
VDTASTLSAIHNDLAPPPLPIRYDRDFPARSWVEQSEWWNARTTFSFLGFMMAVCQAGFTLRFLPVYALILRVRIKTQGHLPWWHDLHRLVPLLGPALLMLIWGISVRLFTRNFG